ncbi:Uncharacterised protein [Chlamydia trachomatis]|nr:Uncharacterised protein [Chlamydia trachomatis]
MPNTRTLVAATERSNTGGSCAARAMSHAETAPSPTPEPTAPEPKRTASVKRFLLIPRSLIARRSARRSARGNARSRIFISIRSFLAATTNLALRSRSVQRVFSLLRCAELLRGAAVQYLRRYLSLRKIHQSHYLQAGRLRLYGR